MNNAQINKMSDRAKATAEFERLLKQSDYLHSIITSHREATAAIFSDVLSLLVQSGSLEPARVLAQLDVLDQDTDRPSEDSTRRVLIQAIREKMKSS
ncbi:hypothetical protein [Burkholderia anthina]|uniref:hypothetical protein n=1 Tax=Burkholderia anthina TaxID=179879 RepID=UPI001AA03FC0|nr:hypothetical protein [Burkholderia anthina]QTD91774.1 hypothetical protein J4G50_26330 [Burkholderia anthina]